MLAKRVWLRSPLSPEIARRSGVLRRRFRVEDARVVLGAQKANKHVTRVRHGAVNKMEGKEVSGVSWLRR